jgi:DNA-binding transcriptional ArsR family regulator
MSLGDGRKRLRALAHPLRLRMLSLMTGAPMSSAELARELGMTHAAASFHVRQLAAAGYIELAETRSVRGGKERRYRARPAGRAEWEGEDPPLVVRAVFEEVGRRAVASSSEAWRLLADGELWVDPAAWDTVVKRVGEAVDALHEAAQAPRTAGSIHVSATALLFAIDDAAESADQATTA